MNKVNYRITKTPGVLCTLCVITNFCAFPLFQRRLNAAHSRDMRLTARRRNTDMAVCIAVIAKEVIITVFNRPTFIHSLFLELLHIFLILKVVSEQMSALLCG